MILAEFGRLESDKKGWLNGIPLVKYDNICLIKWSSV